MTGEDFSADGSDTREGRADLSVALWADLSIGTRRGDAGGAWPASAIDRKTGAADPAPPTSSTTGGGFSPTPPILKAPPVSNGVDTLAFFTTVSTTSFLFLFRTRGGMVGSSVTSSSLATSASGVSSGSGG